MLWVVVFIIQKPVFLLIYTGGLAQAFSVMRHGLPLDFSLAGYLSAVTGLLLLLSSLPMRWLHGLRATKVFSVIHRGWIIVASVVVSLAFVANLGLYGYWRFPLDATPVFFITSSPKDALASVEWWQLVAGLAAIAGSSAAIVLLFRFLFSFFRYFKGHNYSSPGPARQGYLAVAVVCRSLVLAHPRWCDRLIDEYRQGLFL